MTTQEIYEHKYAYVYDVLLMKELFFIMGIRPLEDGEREEIEKELREHIDKNKKRYGLDDKTIAKIAEQVGAGVVR